MFKVIINDDNIQIPEDDIFYVVGKNGQFIRKNMDLIDALVPVKSISVLNNVRPYVRMKIPRINAKVFNKVVSFFKQVYRMHHSEAVVMLYLENDSKKYYIHVPPQKVSGASVDYEREVSFPGKTLVGTIHSHANFGAFHSGTDVGDEKGMDGIHITVGNLGEEFYHSVACSLVSNAFRVKVEPEEYINISKNETKDYIIVEGFFPLEWLDQVSHEPPVIHKWRSQRRYSRFVPGFARGANFLDPDEDEGGDEPDGRPFGFREHDFFFEERHGIYANPNDFIPYTSNTRTIEDYETSKGSANADVIIIRSKTDVEEFFDKIDKEEVEMYSKLEGELCDTYEACESLTLKQKRHICDTCALTSDNCSTCMINDRFRNQVKKYREAKKV